MLVVDGKDAVKAQAFLTLTGTLGSILLLFWAESCLTPQVRPLHFLAGAIVSCAGSVIACLAIATTPLALKG